MRRTALIPVLLVLALGACTDLVGPGARSLEGRWSARVDGETVRITLTDDSRGIRGSGEWGRDHVYVTGDRRYDEVYLFFEFSRYNPIELEGRAFSGEIEGRLYGSGYRGDPVRFERDSWW